MSKGQDWLEELQPGDMCRYGSSWNGLYEVLNVGSQHISLIHQPHGNSPGTGSPFEYEKRHFNREFSIAFCNETRQFSRLKSLLKQASVQVDISKIHNLIVRLEI